MRLDVARHRGQIILAQTPVHQAAADGWVQREIELSCYRRRDLIPNSAIVAPSCRAGLRREVHLRRVAYRTATAHQPGAAVAVAASCCAIIFRTVGDPAPTALRAGNHGARNQRAAKPGLVAT